MVIIDNKNTSMINSLKNALESSDHIDIAVGFFYFSGFQALAKELKNKKVRILVGLEIDPTLIPEINRLSKEDDVDLTKWQSRIPTSSKTILRNNYLSALIGFVNDSEIFDNEKENEIFDMFIKKIENGTLEIRKTITDEHGKFYLVYNKSELSQNGDFPGTLITGSSNFTYKGLVGQGELNDSFRDKSKFDEYEAKFLEMWDDSRSISIVDQNNKEEFLRELKPKIWKFSTPSPFHIYLRVLHELFAREENIDIETPKHITNELFADLEYQIDAVRTVIDKLNRFNGALLADVVGLGKSIIASAVAKNMNIKTVIIAPPHLIPQWEDYKEEFKFAGSKVFSSGNIPEVHERYQESREPILFIIDEAHRFRNEDTNDYRLLHQACRSHRDNKVLLLTATPFNNDPKDVFALVKLFQTPGKATIRSIDNLSLRYRELIKRYKILRRGLRKAFDKIKIARETGEIAQEQRRLIEPIIIRRSRLDLKRITRYREDLERQGIDFAEIVGPELLEYNLGELAELYINTLDTITQTDNVGFIGARYKPTSLEYMTEKNQKIFFNKYKEEIDDIEDIRIAQTNLAKFMKRLLVMRFESSKNAFRCTLDKMIESNKIIENWWEQMGIVPILKKGDLPDPEDYDEEDGDSINNFEKELELLREKKGFLEIEKELLNPVFIEHVRHDTKLLQKIKAQWFDDQKLEGLDPKLDVVIDKINFSLKENPNRKLIIFSVYKDTVDYVYDELLKRGVKRVVKYTASEGKASFKQVIKQNFDASSPKEKQVNDYDVLVATDALSEGFNLHRAGIIINYDIPYNPTRVIQRVGRINRINKKVFDNLYIYNCFPTAIGEEETRIKTISTLKINLINAVVGSDTKTLTPDEDVVSFFRDEFERVQSQSEEISWDTVHKELYEQAFKDEEIRKIVLNLPRRSRIKREGFKDKTGVLVFGKKGDNSVFTFGDSSSLASVVSAELALPLFKAVNDEKGFEVDNNFTQVFNIAKEKLFAKHELPKIQGRRADSIKVVELIGNNIPQAKSYCDDIKKIIREYDDFSEGELKKIAQIDIRNMEEAYKKLLEIIPLNYIQNIFNKADKGESEHELLLFAEQLT